MGELVIVSRENGRHYVTQTIEASLEDAILIFKAAIVAIGNSFEEAQTIANNMK